MPQRSYRWPIRLAILAVIALGVFLWLHHEQTNKLLVIENRANQPVASLEVTMGEEHGKFRNVKAGAEVSTPLRGAGEGRFTVAGELADGTRIRGTFSYDISTMKGDRASLIILSGGQIEFRPDQKASSH